MIQQFGNGENELNSFIFSTPYANNNSSATGVNLHGLGTQGTLVLLDGQRVAPVLQGKFADISAIPLSAVERIEIMSDGASAIYGADAIAGVVNFIMRDDFQGAETQFSYGKKVHSQSEEYVFTQTLGQRWDSGNFLFNYEFIGKSKLLSNDRESIYTNSVPQSVLPGREKHNVMTSFSQSISGSNRISGKLFFNQLENNHHLDTPVLTSYASAEAKQEGLILTFKHDLSDTWAFNLTRNYNKHKLNFSRFNISSKLAPSEPTKKKKSPWFYP